MHMEEIPRRITGCVVLTGLLVVPCTPRWLWLIALKGGDMLKSGFTDWSSVKLALGAAGLKGRPLP